MNQNDYRRLWLKLHRSYEKKAFSIFRKGLRDAAKKIPFDNLDKYNYIPSIEFNVSQEDVFKAYYKAYYQIGMLYGNRITRGIVRDTKGLELDVFQQAFKNELLQWLTHNAALRITTVRQSLINYLIDIIKSGITEGKTVKELAKEIEQLVNSRNFYRWQAMRIARTETTAAANYGASVASSTSIYVLEKIWISSNDARTREIEKGDRYDHVDMDKITVGEKELFDVQGDLIRFPGDPKGQAANIINCRCTVALQPKRDKNGRLIRKGTESYNNFRQQERPIINEPVFSPAKTIKEAEERILRLGVKNVNLKGFKSDQYNHVLKIIEKESKLSPLNLNNLSTFRRKNSQAAALYSPSNNSISINLSHIGNHTKQIVVPYKNQIEDIKQRIIKLEGFIGDPRYDVRKINSRINTLKRSINKIDVKIKNGEEAQFWTVSSMSENSLEYLGNVLTHEIGHLRHYKQLNLTSFFKFDKNNSISEYGRTNFKEYLAEWYGYWRINGSKNVPEDLLKLFNSLK